MYDSHVYTMASMKVNEGLEGRKQRNMVHTVAPDVALWNVCFQ
jgi:hypothetical protein